MTAPSTTARSLSRALSEVAAIAGCLAGATGAVYAMGGAPATTVHLLYFPIIYAAARFGRRGGVATAVVAGLLAGPFLPQDVATGTPQPAHTWVVRLVLFVAVALVVQWLARQEPRPLRELLSDVAWGQRLRRALRRDEVAMHYQPIVDLGTGSMVGVEALCRWSDGRGGFHPPAVFIPAAEHNGAIAPLARTVMAMTARQAASWATDPRQRRMVTVNVSAVQLSAPAFLADLAELVVAHALTVELYCLEITETALIRDPARALATLRAVHAMGLKIAIDDFGTGYASLSYLRDFPVDYIKIDRSFVDDVDRDPKVNNLTEVIIEMAAALGATTIAEGIERQSQLDSLRALGCNLGQGWLLGRPVPAEQIAARHTTPARRPAEHLAAPSADWQWPGTPNPGP